MKLFNYMKLLHKYNSLKLENERLKKTIKDNWFKQIIKQHDTETINESLKTENKKLRELVRTLKNKINNSKEK